MFWTIFEIILIVIGIIAAIKCIEVCDCAIYGISVKGVLLGLCSLVVFGYFGIVVISSRNYIPITMGIDTAIIILTVFTSKKEDKIWQEKQDEKYQKRCNFVVRNAVNQTLNRNVSSYLKTGYVYDDYYSYSYVSDYSSKLNKGFEEFISEYKYRLLEQAKNSKDFKIYQTESGMYAEAYLGYLFYNEVSDEEYFKFPYACLNPYNHSTFFLRVFERYGIILDRNWDLTPEMKSKNIAYDVYAYVKL